MALAGKARAPPAECGRGPGNRSTLEAPKEKAGLVAMDASTWRPTAPGRGRLGLVCGPESGVSVLRSALAKDETREAGRARPASYSAGPGSCAEAMGRSCARAILPKEADGDALRAPAGEGSRPRGFLAGGTASDGSRAKRAPPRLKE